jgi:hypothetical protein
MVDRFRESDRQLSKFLFNPSSDFLSSWITRCILRCTEPIKLLISPISRFSTPPWGPGWVHIVTLVLRSSIADDTVWTPIPFCRSIHLLINKLSQPPYRSIGSRTDLNGSSWWSTYANCHNVSEDFWSLAIILVVNFATKGTKIVQRTFTKSYDDRRKSGHKKAKRRIIKENKKQKSKTKDKEKAKRQIKNKSRDNKRKRGIKKN